MRSQVSITMTPVLQTNVQDPNRHANRRRKGRRESGPALQDRVITAAEVNRTREAPTPGGARGLGVSVARGNRPSWRQA